MNIKSVLTAVTASLVNMPQEDRESRSVHFNGVRL
jgi:hypothetical protein